MIDRQKLARKVREWLAQGTESDDSPQLREVQVQHRTGKIGDPGIVNVFRIRDAVVDDAALVSSIVAAITEDSEGLGGRQHYYIIPHFGAKDGPCSPVGRYTCYVDGAGSPDEDVDDGVSSEAPTSKGLLSQLMRHLETQTRSASALTMHTMNQQRDQIADLQDQVHRAQSVHLNLIAMTEQMISQKHARDLAEIRQQQEAERVSMVYKQLSSLLPIVLSRFTGQAPGSPSDDASISVLVERITESINPEQYPALMGALSPDQQMLLAELLRKSQERKEASDVRKIADQASSLTEILPSDGGP